MREQAKQASRAQKDGSGGGDGGGGDTARLSRLRVWRLEPLTDPEKSPAVKSAIAQVAHRLRAATGASYGSTNIEEHLVR